MSFESNNADSLLLSDKNSSNDGIKKPNSILKKPKNKKQNSNDSDIIPTVKKKLLNESSIEMLNDNTLDGFSIEENTVDIIDDEEMSHECSQNVVTFNLIDNNTQQDASESSTSTSQQQQQTTVKKRKRRGSAFHVDQSLASKISVSQLFVYKWPQDEPTSSELFILQEQVSDYLEIKSFKRKYPDIYRRSIELNEREYLKENKIVSETQCDLGLTALKLNDVLLIMSEEYADKYKEFNNLLNEKRKALAATQMQKKKSEAIKSSNKSLDKTKLKELTRKAIKSAAEYNSQLQKEKKEERKLFFDMHTMRIQVPRTKEIKLTNKPISSYPVSLIEGQYQDYYKKYTTEELKYLPLNTILYSCPKPTHLMYWEWKHESHSLSENQNSSDEKDDFEETVNINKTHSALTNILNNNNQITENHVKAPKVEPPTIATCYVCQKSASSDQMIHCSSCPNYSHPSCLELNPSLVSWNCIRNYNWQCMECKICSTCNEAHDEDKMMFCDRCDRGFHTYCVGVKEVPSGSWLCITCKSNEAINTNTKSTPVKMKINSILSNGGSINVSPAKRGRPIGSLNKPKIPQQMKDKSLVKDGSVKNSNFLLRDLFDSANGDSSTAADTSMKKGRGRPKKTSLDNSSNFINTAGYSNTNSKDDEFIMDHDDDYSLNSYNYTNTCVIDDNISNQFYAFNS